MGLELYERLRRGMLIGTVGVVVTGAALLAVWRPYFGLVLLAGGGAGILNALLSMYGNQRLLERRNIPVFVLSSFLRLCLFGIVPVALALRVPSLWTLAWYFIGFFTPLGLYGLLLHRALRNG